jgi:hypothetical protein
VPVSESVAVKQAIRLCSLLAGDGSDILQEELVEALRGAAINDDHCIRITSEWIKYNKFRPMPAELYTLGEAIPGYSSDLKSDKKCVGCQGTGWEQAWELVTYHRKNEEFYKTKERITDPAIAADLRKRVDNHSQRVYDGVIRCSHCNYGRSLAMAEEQRAIHENEPRSR